VTDLHKRKARRGENPLAHKWMFPICSIRYHPSTCAIWRSVECRWLMGLDRRHELEWLSRVATGSCLPCWL